MERALLEGEQQIQLEHLESAKEKVASLEAKEARLLAEAAAERAKVPVILCCMFVMLYLKFMFSIMKVLHLDVSLCQCFWLRVSRHILCCLFKADRCCLSTAYLLWPPCRI